MLAALAGLSLGLSLIIAIGAQNVFVLRQGIARQHVGVVVAICAASDALLILAGVAGLGAVLLRVPWLIGAVRWFGAAFLLAYGLLAARRAWLGSDEALVAEGAAPSGSRTRLATVVATCLALTWLNPHVYLDTVFLLGSVAATHGEQRWAFALGAMVGSATWFSSLGFGARHLARWLRTRRAWRVLDSAIAVLMVTLAVRLVAA